jgi:hypothetical protein
MTAYLIKYLTKNDKHRRTIQGRLWGCSRNLSQAGSIIFTFPEYEAFDEWKYIKCPTRDERNYDWCSIKWLPPTYYEALPECELKKEYFNRIRAIRYKYQPPELFFFDDKGNGITLEEAVKRGLPKSQAELHKLELYFDPYVK